jgi:hypothetical protein
MADNKISKYLNTYNEGEFLSPDDVRRGQDFIKANIPLGLGLAPILPTTQQTEMTSPVSTNQNQIIRNAGIFLEPTQPNQLSLSPMSQPMPEQQDDDSGRFLASLIAQGAAGFGTGISGGSAADIQRSAGTFQTMRDAQENQRIAKLLTDPTSEESKKKREVYKSLGYQVPSNLSATDLNDPTVLQTLKGQMQEQKLAAMPRGGIGLGKPKKESLDKNPFNKEIVITSNMARSVDSDLKELLDIIEKSGNSPISGTDSLRQKQLVGKIAINYNKILDPGSIVKPEEAEAVVKTLGLDWLTRSNVSKDAVSQFKNAVSGEAQNRLQGYYGMYSTFDENEAKVIEKYKENPNDPKLIEAFSNIIKLKRMQGK